jgi:1,4-dihydroxy-2-naphthoyl-CoA hydrolase
MFVHRMTVQLHHTDAFGIIFFANQLVFCHDAFQAFLLEIGVALPPRRPQAGPMLVVVHADSEYTAAMAFGDRLDIAVTVSAIGTTSLTMAFLLRNQHQIVVGSARTVHVTIDAATNLKTPLPPLWRSAFAAHCA